MDRTQRKRYTRKNLVLKNKKDRFISGYIQAKFPQIYDEANICYDRIASVYPNKRDLTKTVEFIYMTTGATSLSQYYHNKRVEKARKQSEKEPAINDNMVLKIPLFDANLGRSSHRQQETNDHEVPLPVPDEVYQNLLQELRNDPELYSIFNDMDMSRDDSIDLSEEQQLSVTIEQPNESNPDTRGEDIVNDLCQDPELHAILSDEQTPLERELSHLGY